jgi:short subunit dehydrogenase-like uncharacterized protein
MNTEVHSKLLREQMNSIMVLGGYGHFGVKISEALIKSNIPVIIVGRNQDKLTSTVHHFKKNFPSANISGSCFDIYEKLNEKLKEFKPSIVIHTSGPFQNKDYTIPKI